MESTLIYESESFKNNRDMCQIYFKTPQVKILTEIYRRLNFFHKGNVNEKLMLLALPSEVKSIKEFGIIEPYNKEVPRTTNWYSLTTKGKMFFKNYIKKISEKENLELFEGNKTVNFIKSDLDKLTERISDGWVLDDSYYNKEVVKCDVYSKKFGRGTVYIQNQDSFMFTCSFGANSDLSHSGSFYNVETIKTVEDGMKYLDEFVPLWISNNRNKIIELKQRYKF